MLPNKNKNIGSNKNLYKVFIVAIFITAKKVKTVFSCCIDKLGKTQKGQGHR